MGTHDSIWYRNSNQTITRFECGSFFASAPSIESRPNGLWKLRIWKLTLDVSNNPSKMWMSRVPFSDQQPCECQRNGQIMTVLRSVNHVCFQRCPLTHPSPKPANRVSTNFQPSFYGRVREAQTDSFCNSSFSGRMLCTYTLQGTNISP